MPKKMHQPRPYSLLAGGKLFDLSRPRVMGILNATPDSFYAASRAETEAALLKRAEAMLVEGAAMLDVGGYSSRPGASEVTPAEEWERLHRALGALRREFPDAILSVDTFRAEVAARCVEQHGVNLINDISGGTLDEEMFATVARLNVPYVLMHMRGTPQTMQQCTDYVHPVQEVAKALAGKINRLRALGVKDLIADPGFGFGKTPAQNFELLKHLDVLHLLEVPLLVGVSRKSMIYRTLDCTPAEALNGTTAVHTIALLKGASILRVHDVKAAAECIALVQKMQEQP